ncbi:MAG: ribulose-phosphate 3-epimerase [Tabrizicola sp.]|uniref:ribulose-phosphate 3-epimerase n=1 Tax=Tabrizicola sp. TaxID=2005166 RepID=UPI002AB7FB7A|nr:ribulose-phosphate 3-epimerase [Tabrizicola sp.]MDZ4086382.1 ribulose-phosphate 3-epimerase [Tabrizicola sp.]
MPRPAADWLTALPRNRLLAEYSMWSADLIRLADDLTRITPHADILHIDVADGYFAPAFLFFPDLVARMRDITALPIHVHLMVSDAVLLSQIDQFAEAGADLISLHVENANAAQGLDRIAEHGLKAGMVLRVETPVAEAAPWLDRLDMLTLLGTAIGVKGQGLNPAATSRLQEAARLIAATGRRIVLAADGGIRDTTVPLLRAAGAETVVMGSLAFGAPDLAKRMAWLHGL